MNYDFSESLHVFSTNPQNTAGMCVDCSTDSTLRYITCMVQSQTRMIFLVKSVVNWRSFSVDVVHTVVRSTYIGRYDYERFFGETFSTM